MKKFRMPCIRCGERHVLKRRVPHEQPTERQLRQVRFASLGFCLAAVCLASCGLLFKDFFSVDINKFCIIGAATAGSIAAVLLLASWYFKVFPFTRTEMYHFKCSKCGITWDEHAPARRASGTMSSQEAL